MPREILDEIEDEEVDDEPVHYSSYDIEVLDIDGETVAMTDSNEDLFEVEEMFDKLSPGAGGEIILRELQYSNSNLTGYLKTVVIKSKK